MNRVKESYQGELNTLIILMVLDLIFIVDAYQIIVCL